MVRNFLKAVSSRYFRPVHYPPYVNTGYFKKGWQLKTEIKRQFDEQPEVAYTWLITLFCTFVMTPLCAISIYNYKKDPASDQFRRKYSIIRDTEMETDAITKYNPVEVELAKKTSGLFK